MPQKGVLAQIGILTCASIIFRVRFQIFFWDLKKPCWLKKCQGRGCDYSEEFYVLWVTHRASPTTATTSACSRTRQSCRQTSRFRSGPHTDTRRGRWRIDKLKNCNRGGWGRSENTYRQWTGFATPETGLLENGFTQDRWLPTPFKNEKKGAKQQTLFPEFDLGPLPNVTYLLACERNSSQLGCKGFYVCPPPGFAALRAQKIKTNFPCGQFVGFSSWGSSRTGKKKRGNKRPTRRVQ